MTRFVFVHPPLVSLEAFPLDMIGVATRLAHEGATVDVFDANSACHRAWLDTPFLRAQIARMERLVHQLSLRSELTSDERSSLQRAVHGIVAGETALAALPDALRAMDKPRSKRALATAIDIALWPAAHPSSPIERIADVLALAAAPPDSNRFVRFWQAWLEDRRFQEPQTLVLWLEHDRQLVPAVTLARLLRSRGPDLRVVLAGPFATFVRQASKSDRWWKRLVDDLAPRALRTASSDDVDPDLLRAFCKDHVLRAPRIVPLHTTSARVIASIHKTFPDARLHITTPTSIASLVAIPPSGARLSAMVKAGFDLDRITAKSLLRAGFETLHFQITGHANYASSEEAARSTILSSLSAARRAGLATLASLVYGHPTDRAGSFERFASAMASEKDTVDRWVHFEPFRLERFSVAWSRPHELGIASRFTPPPDHELARHVAFTTASGLDSRTFTERAARALETFAPRPIDFPSAPTLHDEAIAPKRPPHLPLSFRLAFDCYVAPAHDHAHAY